MPDASSPDLAARIEGLPEIERLAPALAGLPTTYLVGGAVRDLLRGARPADLDVAVEGSAEEAARELAAHLDGDVEVVHERFGTAAVVAREVSLDLATTRRERYPHPGALPEVEPAPIGEDLGRRDFTVNAMAAPLGPERRGELLDPLRGRDDLEAGTLRVLHDRSFVDDPTRLLRAVRYEARLGFVMDRHTESLARAAVSDRVSDTVSGKRIGTELLLVLGEAHVRAALERLVDLGLDRALDPALEVDPPVVAEAARAASASGADRVLAALAALVRPAPDALADWLASLGLDASGRRRVERAARSAPSLARELRDRAGFGSASEVRALLAPEPPETLALALALGAPNEPIAHHIESLRSVRLDIGGDDLVAAGVDPSPALGRALEETLRRKLDGEVAGREDELALALTLARRDGEAGR